MAVREFDGVDDNIVCATGGLSGIIHGTVAVLVQRRNSGDFYALMGINDSGGALLGSVLFWDNDNWTWYKSSVGSQGPASPLNTWALMVVRKATGSATPRFSIYDYAADAWTHTNGGSAQGDWTSPGNSGEIAFTDAANDHPAIRIAARAAWANEVHWAADTTGDSAIEAAGLETALSNWLDESPTALWRFNQDTTSEDVVDETGNGADQTSITGTTVVTGDDPPGFDFSLGATAGMGVGFGAGFSRAGAVKLGTGSAAGVGGGFAAAAPAKVGSGKAEGVGGGFAEATVAKLGGGAGQGTGGGSSRAQVATLRRTRAKATGGGAGRAQVSRTAAGSATAFGGGFGAHRPPVVVIPGILTPGSSRPLLMPSSTRPGLTPGSTRPLLTPGR